MPTAAGLLTGGRQQKTALGGHANMNLMYHFADCIETGSTGGESKEVPAPPATATESAPAPFRIPVQTGPQFDRAGKPTSRWTIPIQHRPPAPGEAGGESTTEPPSDEPFTAIL